MNTGLTTLSVGSLVMDAMDSNTLYAGTFGGGVFKSTDGGKNWSAVNNGLTNQTIQALAADPVVSGTVYAGTFGSSIFASYDEGETWK